MKNKITFYLLVFLLISGFLFSQDTPMRISYITGNVMVQRGYDFGFEDATLNLPITSGDRIMSEEGRVEIQLKGFNYLRLDRYTKADIEERGNSLYVKVLSGSIYLDVKEANSYEDIVVGFPSGEAVLLENGEYRIDVKNNGTTLIKVYEGVSEVYTNDGTKYVRRSQLIQIESGRFLTAPSYIYHSNRDDFDFWNEERNKMKVRYTKRGRYLQGDLSYYEDDLSQNGTWVYISSCGYCWRPRVTISYWRPYYFGRWTWVYPYGWVWVSYEPFGWITYHYGWWYWDPYYGWVWRPGYTWAPAWVRWYYWNDYVAWVPIDWYGYPVIIVNGRRWTRYDRLPITARSAVVLRKNQLMSKDVSKFSIKANTTSLKKVILKPANSQPFALKKLEKIRKGDKIILKRNFTPTFAKTKGILTPSKKFSSIQKNISIKNSFNSQEKRLYKKTSQSKENTSSYYNKKGKVYKKDKSGQGSYSGASIKKKKTRSKTSSSSPSSSSSSSSTTKKKIKKKKEGYYYKDDSSTQRSSYRYTTDSNYSKRSYRTNNPYKFYYYKKSSSKNKSYTYSENSKNSYYKNPYRSYYNKNSSSYYNYKSNNSYNKNYNYSSYYKRSRNSGGGFYYKNSSKSYTNYSKSSGSKGFSFKSKSSSTKSYSNRGSYTTPHSSSRSSSRTYRKKKD